MKLLRHLADLALPVMASGSVHSVVNPGGEGVHRVPPKAQLPT